MSTSSQNNGKKSSNSSVVNTPSSTPVTHLTNGGSQMNAQNSPPPNNAPKYGTLVPNRIFVGGISSNTTEGDLMELFSSYGTVKAAKVIQDRAGVSKGYGFITFETEEDARKPLKEPDNIVLKERKLNIAPAIKKQPFSRAFDASSPTAVAAGNPAPFFFPPGAAMPYFQGGVAYYPQPNPAAPGDMAGQQPVYQPPAVYPTQTGPPQSAPYPSMMFPAQTIYMPPQYPMAMPYDYNFYQTNGGPPSTQYLLGNQGGPGGPQCGPMQPSTSPPRPPCYGQQMPAYNSADPMFYNLPVYGATLEGAPVYGEAYELAAAGPYTEDNYNTSVTPQDIDSSTVHHGSINNNNNNNHPHHHSHHNHHPSRQQTTEGAPHHRNAHTPVVSLLSIEQQQEKDYSSMQSGRRRRPANGYPPPVGGYHQPPPPFHNGYVPPARGGAGGRRRGGGGGMSSRSSLRTDSNSSAEGARPHAHTPPPAPYSPMAQQQFAANKYNNYNYNNNSYARASYEANKPNNGGGPVDHQSFHQVHVSAQQSFGQSPSSGRRNKRGGAVRRGGSGGPHEMGAGDAPMPVDAGGAGNEVCKKLETLKL